jgi:D-glycero-alpha-D-manno-heptose-7-phosphate kinase
MIITRTPFRITLGGGGTDLPSFYEEHGGFVFSMSIDKYMYIFLHALPVTHRHSIIRYSEVECVSSIDEIRHPLAREVLRLHDVHEFVEVTSMADLPARTGLGSSGSYLVGLLTAVHTHKKRSASQQELADQACHIEMDILKEPVGKQDQYMAAFGGFQVLEISTDGNVEVTGVPVDFTMASELVTKTRMYYTGVQRSATNVLMAQDQAAREASRPDHKQVVESLERIKDIGRQIRVAFEAHDLDTFGRLMDEHWKYKQQMSPRIGLTVFDQLYDEVKRRFGVLGGKIIGAGGGGFVLLYCPHKARELDVFMAGHDMPQVDMFPAFEGAKVVSDFGN